MHMLLHKMPNASASVVYYIPTKVVSQAQLLLFFGTKFNTILLLKTSHTLDK